MKNKRIVSLTVLVLLICSCCMFTLVGCGEKVPEERYVDIEVLHPTTGKVLEIYETVVLPDEETPIKVQVRDRETGVLLTDDDLPENTVDYACYMAHSLNSDGYYGENGYKQVWPSRIDIREDDRFSISVQFDSKPWNISGHFDRKYASMSYNVSFYVV